MSNLIFIENFSIWFRFQNLEKLNGYEERLRTLDKELTSFKVNV